MMRILLFLFVVTATTLSCDGQKKKESPSNTIITNYYFIRHAEKDLSDPSNRNPDLTIEGEERAERWKAYFSDKDIDAVYSTDYIRTMRTAEPTAVANNVEIQSYNPSELFSEDFKVDTAGKNIVVVGHSNTTPNFANAALGENSFKDIDESEYFHLYHVQLIVNDETGEVIDKKYNAVVVD
ncbi:phosphoglycerate mutase family protein [uncultured Dokdonia sp.]|uniref:SixA phosphatase family protein n=1 Tax=uncultured Dokdonia sp. TaxID=575653 RepID=UPI0030EC4573|tara:strand:+ start:19016 stop:19561 length:546 start_codon:yes stop_codon:yes gene_type:complete